MGTFIEWIRVLDASGRRNYEDAVAAISIQRPNDSGTRGILTNFSRFGFITSQDCALAVKISIVGLYQLGSSRLAAWMDTIFDR